MRYGLTPRQAQLLDFVKFFNAEHGFAPSYEEIRFAMDLASKATVHRLVHSLVKRGHIKHMPGYGRSIVLCEAA